MSWVEHVPELGFILVERTWPPQGDKPGKCSIALEWGNIGWMFAMGADDHGDRDEALENLALAIDRSYSSEDLANWLMTDGVGLLPTKPPPRRTTYHLSTFSREDEVEVLVFPQDMFGEEWAARLGTFFLVRASTYPKLRKEWDKKLVEWHDAIQGLRRQVRKHIDWRKRVGG